MDKCKYTRDYEIEMYTPDCCWTEHNEERVPSDSIHPDDCEDWNYCPYCGGKVKRYTDGVRDE